MFRGHASGGIRRTPQSGLVRHLGRSLALVITTTLIATGMTLAVAAPTLQVDTHTFEFLGVTLNDDGTSTWAYRITSGTAPSLSHWVLELDPALDEDDILYASEDNEVGTDPRTDVFGLKFDEGYDDGESREVTFTMDGWVEGVPTRIATKAGRNTDVGGSITGPGTDEIEGGGNQPPIAVDDEVTTQENKAIKISVLDNDSDPDGDSLQIESFTEAENGQVKKNGKKKVRYIPVKGFSGTDTFTYTVSDGEGGAATATVTVEVGRVNDAPSAVTDSAETNQNEPVSFDILSNDTDPDGTIDPTTVEITEGPDKGEIGIDPDTGEVTYTPEWGAYGVDTFRYTVKDNDGAVSNPVTVSIRLIRNQGPTATPDTASTDANIPVSIDILANDIDPDGVLDPETIEITKQPSRGELEIDENTGLVTYSPDEDRCGTDFFTYRVQDDDDALSGRVRVDITVTCNDDPEARDDAAATDEGRAVDIAILANDTDPDGFLDPSTVEITRDPKDGTVGVNPATGAVTYTPDDGFCGDDEFRYTVRDNDGAESNEAKARIYVLCNEPPIARDDEATTDENTSITVDVAANDDDPDGTLDPSTVTVTDQPRDGTVSVHPSTGVITYTPDPGSCGVDVFEYTISDDKGKASELAAVEIDVLCNEPPRSIDDLYNTSEGQTLRISDPGVLANDVDAPGSPLTARLIDGVEHGELSLASDGSFVYVHDGTETTSDAFTYVTHDGKSDSNEATVNIVIAPMNDQPTASDDEDETDEDEPVEIDVLDNDTDPDGDRLSVDWAGSPSHGSVINNGDSITYAPDPDFHGTDTFDYGITDGNGGTDTASVVVDVRPINDAPIAQGDSEQTAEDTPVAVFVLVNDSDPDGDPLSIEEATAPEHGTVRMDGERILYLPDADFHGEDAFIYTVEDGEGKRATAMVDITVTPVNDPPVAEDDVARTDEDAPVMVPVLANDTDADGDRLSVEAFARPSHGAVSLDGDRLTYAPEPQFHGVDSFTYTLSDGQGGTDEAEVEIIVDPINDPPVSLDDARTIQEDTAVAIDVLENDTDIDGDGLTIISVTEPDHGTAEARERQIVYTPERNFHGDDTFLYEITDGNGGLDIATVEIIVLPVNDEPAATDDQEETNEDQSVEIDVLANDSDPDGDRLSILSVTQPANGAVENSGSSVLYTPNPNAYGEDTFGYVITDGEGGTDTATVRVMIRPVNDAPDARDDTDATQEDTPITIQVLANDYDLDGDNLEIEDLTAPSHGAVEQSGDSILYTPDPDFHGTDTFGYAIDDGAGGSDAATVTVSVASVNDTPTAVDDEALTPEDTPVEISLLANDIDPDGDDLGILSVDPAANGSVEIRGSIIVYTPDPQYHGRETFEYAISDGAGGGDTAVVSIIVTPVNDEPLAQDDSETTDEDTSVSVPVLGNDSDPDGDDLRIESTTQPSNGSAAIQGMEIEYTPAPGFNGADAFDYTITDEEGGFASATVRISIGAANDAPAANDDFASTDEDTAVAVLALANDSDPDGDSLIIESVGIPGSGSVVNSGSDLVYTPNTNAYGTDTFEYTISDGNGGTDTATVIVDVAPRNDAPVAQDDSAGTEEDVPVVIDVLPNDFDIDGDVLTIQAVGAPANGTGTSNGRDVTYTPDPGFNGSDTFNYTIADGAGGTDTATVTVSIGAVNDPPTAVDDAATTDEDTAVSIDVLVNDRDPDDDPLSVESVTQPAHGSLSIDSASILYTPDPQYSGADSFEYTASDGLGGTDTATVQLTVNPVNDPPLAQDDSGATQEDTSLVVGVLANDTDPEGDDLSILTVGSPAHGQASVGGAQIAYTPDPGYHGSDVFIYTIGDGNGGEDTASVLISVGAVNDLPDAADDAASTPEDVPVTLDVLANDSDADGDDLSIQSVTQPSAGEVENNGADVTFTPNANTSETVTFTYTVTDGHGGTDTATVTVNVTPVNDPPTAQNDSASTEEDSPVTILVLANDMDVDGDPLAIDGVAQPAGGSVAIDGTRIVYTPSGGFSGTDTFDYTVSDGNGGTDTATVTIAVARINRSPVAVDDEATTQEDEPTTIAVLLNDSDPDNDPLTVQSVGRPEHGTAAPSGASIVYTPDPNYAGPDRFSYTISDGNGGTATADVTVEVLARNDPPRAQNDSQSTSEESAVTIFVLANDSDPDEDNLVIQSVEQPNHGTVSNEGDHLVYRPESGFSGVDDFSYTVADGNGGADTAHVTVVIGTVNDAPVAQDDTVATDEDTLIEIPVLANDSDPDGDFLIVETFSEPDHGTVLNTRTGLSYIPDDGFQGTDSFTYTVSDGNGGVDVAEVTVAVAGVNDAPTALDDTSNTDEGMPVEIPVLLNDTDPEGDRLVIQSVTSPEHGVAAIAEDAVEYTPTGEFNGVDQFSYAVSDGQGGTATATVFVAVAGINDAPIAQDDSGTTAQGQSISIPVLGNDDDPDGDSLTISGASGGVGGSLRIDGGTIIYTPSDGFSGTDVFTYSVADGLGGSDTATVTVGVTAGGQGGAINAAACEGRVIISEVAWAGTTSDARDEWIELRNLGTTPVDLSGWLLQWRPTHARAAEDQIWKRVELSGTIAGAATASCDELDGGTTPPLEITEEADGAYRVTGHPSLIKSNYYVLERRHEDTIADSRANLIYGTTPDMDYQLSDSGDIVMLVDPSGEVVSTANAPNLGRSGWVAGSATTLGTMERIDPLGPDISSNWQTNLGIVAGGHDANGRLLRATPGAENSPSLESLPTYAGLEATTVRQGEMPSLRFDLSRQQRRTTGWPWISVSRPGFAGEGGSIDLSRYSFAGQHEGDQGYILDIGTDTLSPGLYNFLVIHGEGEAVLLPILITP